MKAFCERNKGGRPKSAAPKKHIGFRLSADLVVAIRATGKGYNARVDKALRGAFIEMKPTRPKPPSKAKTTAAALAKQRRLAIALAKKHKLPARKHAAAKRA